MAFTAADVKNLREMTGVGMMDCKKALTASDGDMDKAVEFLREKGLAASAKKAGRVAAEGMAYAAVIDGVGVVVEVNAETDFVGKNEKFVGFVKGVAATVAANKPVDLEALMACKYNGTDLTVEQQQQEMVLVIGENIKVRRFAIFTEGVSVPYIHAGGKIGVLVNLKVEGDIDATAVGKDVAMQIAALNPRFWDKSQVSQDVLDEEKKIMMVQMENDPKMASKPEQVREKIVMGKMNKFYSENCLLQQEFVRGDVFTGTVEQYIADAAKKLGGKITFVDAIRFEKGEEPYQVNPNSNTPRIIYGDFRNSRDADRFLENGSYFRMKNISIGYNFKQKWLTNLGVEKLRLFATGSNLITITGYSGLDPDFKGANSVWNSGTDSFAYPNTRSVMFGLDLTF